jgi:hypothetical protein
MTVPSSGSCTPAAGTSFLLAFDYRMWFNDYER